VTASILGEQSFISDFIRLCSGFCCIVLAAIGWIFLVNRSFTGRVFKLDSNSIVFFGD
jgi:hypothetical protein